MISIDEEEYDSPVIEIDEDAIVATYYKDLSGEVVVKDIEGEQIFYTDCGKLKHHIKDIEGAIKDLQKSYKNNLKNYKRAITVLTQEQNKIKKIKNRKR